MQGIVAGKEAEENQDKDGRTTSQIRLVRWQQAEWQRTGINFAETYGHRRLNEGKLYEEEMTIMRLDKICRHGSHFKPVHHLQKFGKLGRCDLLER